MGNPIQFAIPIRRGGFKKRLQYAPPGRTQRGVNENVSPALICPCTGSCSASLYGAPYSYYNSYCQQRAVGIRLKCLLVQIYLLHIDCNVLTVMEDTQSHKVKQ